MNNIKEDILKSSRELFTNYGYKKVSMDEIAKASGVTKKTVYSYFKDKASLLKTLIDEEMAKMKKIIISHSNINDENFFEGVNKTLYDLLKYKREAKLFVTLTKEADELNTISSKNSIEMIDDAILSFIKERLSWAIEKGYVKKCDPDLCAFIIYKVYVAVMFEWDKEIDENEVTQNVTQILKEGLFN